MRVEAANLNKNGFIIMPVGSDKIPPKGFAWKYLQTCRSQPESQISRWWGTQYKDFNIAVITGNGVFAVDADSEEAMKIIEENLPDTPATSFTGKGKHYLYRMPSFPIGNSVNPDTKIDIRGVGGYIVAPPSLHGQTGKRYTWKQSLVHVNTLPELTEDHYRFLYQVTKNRSLEQFALPQEKRSIKSKPSHSGDVRDLTGLYQEIASLLHKASPYESGVKACCPAHNDNSPSFTVKICAEGNILMSCFAGCTFEAICASLGIKPEDCFAVPPKKLETQFVEVDFKNFKVNKEDSGEDYEELIADKKETHMPEFPKELLRPPGLVGEICDYINDNGRIDQPVLALAAALSLVSTISGRRVQTQSLMRPNLYTIGVARSGGGKEWPRTAIEWILEDAGIDEKCLGGEQLASDTGAVVEIKNMPTILYMIDEFGKYTQAMFHKNAPTHIQGIITLLMSIYEKSNKKFRWKQFADERRERLIIDQPNVSLFGTTVSHNFWDGITKDQVIDGFLNRFLVFQSNTLKKKDKFYSRRPPKELVEKIKKIWEMPEHYDPSVSKPGVNLKELRPNPKVLLDTADAEDLFLNYSNWLDDTYLDENGEDTLESAIWRRTLAHGYKIALNIANGCFSNEIDAEHAMWGINISKACAAQAYHGVMMNVSDNLTEKNTKKVLSIITESGKKGITKAILYRKTHSLSRVVREDILQTLVEGEQIMGVKVKSNGPKPTLIYYPMKGAVKE